MGLFEKMMGHAREFSRATGLSDTDVKSAGRLSPCEDGLREELGRRAEACTTVLRFALLFSGDVQGVGFRWTNQSLAHERHLVGWVKNLPDGTVQHYEEDVNRRYEREIEYFTDYALGDEQQSCNPPALALDVLKLTLGEH